MPSPTWWLPDKEKRVKVLLVSGSYCTALTTVLIKTNYA